MILKWKEKETNERREEELKLWLRGRKETKGER